MIINTLHLKHAQNVSSVIDIDFPNKKGLREKYVPKIPLLGNKTMDTNKIPKKDNGCKLFVSGVVPITVLSYLNIGIIRTMKKNNLLHNKMCSSER